MSYKGSDSYKKIIFIGDGATDYIFLEKILEKDPDLAKLPIKILKPEDVNMKRRTGGGHKTLIKEAGFAAIKAANGYADGVIVAVDNDCDDRFVFPHEKRCGDCRECEVYNEMANIDWGLPVKKEAFILFQAVETILLSVRNDFTYQMEEKLCHKALKDALYKREINDPQDVFEAFNNILEQIDVMKIKARSYSRLKKKLINIISDK